MLVTINVSATASEILWGILSCVFHFFNFHLELVERTREKTVGLENSVLYLVQVLFA